MNTYKRHRFPPGVLSQLLGASVEVFQPSWILEHVGFDRSDEFFGLKYSGEPSGGRLLFSVRLFAVLPKPSI